MTVHDLYASQRTAARVAGAACLLSIVIVVLAHYRINYQLIVPGDATATAQNILAHEGLFRLNIACDLLYSMGVIVQLTALYTLLAPVHRSLALFGAVIRLVYGLMYVGIAFSLCFALRILHGASYLHVLSTDQLQSLARLVLGTGFEAYYVGLPFYALAATVCSYLLYKSRYIPRALAILGVIGSAWGVLCAFVFILVRNFGKTVDPYWFDSPLGIAEMAISLWLLIRGIRPAAIESPVTARGAA